MKTKLLKKIRLRITEVEFRNNGYVHNKGYVHIKYYNRVNGLASYNINHKRDLIVLIDRMFGDHFANIIDYRNEKSIRNRNKKKINKSIKYTWE